MNNLVDAINELIDGCSFAATNENVEENTTTIVFGEDYSYYPESSVVNQKNAALFENVVSEILRNNKEITHTLSRKSISDFLARLILRYAQSGQSIDKKKLQTIISQEIEKTSIREYEVFYKIYGLNVSKEDPLKVGNFQFYNTQSLKKHMDTTAMGRYCLDALLPRVHAHYTIISTKVKARDTEKAWELAYEDFDVLENILRFFISFWNLKHFDIGIVHPKKIDVHEYMMLQDDGLGSGRMGSSVRIEALDFDEFQGRFIGANITPIDVMKKFCKQDKNEIENRLLRAMELVGRAVFHFGKPTSFLFSIMAIEALLQVNTNQLVNQSISAQISEYIAFLLEANYENRVAMEKKMKHFYNIRSKIAHGSSYKCSFEECKEALETARSLVCLFFTDDTLRRFTKLGDLQNYIRKLKYK